MRYMRLTDPHGLRIRIAREKDWHTDKEIAEGCGLSESTVNSAFNRESVRVGTVKTIAGCLGLKAVDIAEFTS